MFGGFGQLVAAIKGYDARDNLATTIHWAWSAAEPGQETHEDAAKPRKHMKVSKLERACAKK